MSGPVRWVPGLTLRPTSSDDRPNSDISVSTLSVNDKLAKLRSETRRQALNKRHILPLPSSSSHPPVRQTEHPGHIFLAQQALSNGSSGSTIQLKRVAGPPPPASWRSAFALSPHRKGGDLNDVDLASSVWDTSDSEGLLRRRRQIKGVDDHLASQGPAGLPPPSPTISLLDSCLLVIARDPEPFTQVISLVPIHLLMRILELATIYAPLADSAVQALLLPEDGDDRAEEEKPSEKRQEPAVDGDQESSWEDLVYTTSPLDVWAGAAWSFSSLVTLDLCFSCITLATLRSLLFLPTTASPTTIPRLPSLRTLLLAHTPNLPLSPPLLSLFPRLNSLHVISLAHKRPPTYPARVFLSRLAASTPLLRTVDLGYSEWIGGPDDLQGVDWSARWKRLECIVLAGCPQCYEDGDDAGGAERRGRVVQSSVTKLLKERGRIAPWLRVQT
jgi:hypothetical protein